MKLTIGIMILVCIFEFIFSRRQLVVPRCERILDPYLCQNQNHCRWSHTLDECLSRHGFVRGVAVHRPYLRGGFVARPGFAVHSRPVAVSRPMISRPMISRPMISRPMIRN
jgi:hypothetical protein